jgi:hypothetical protein
VPRAPAEGWIGFVNREAAELQKLQPAMPLRALRGHLRDRLRETFRFPMQTVVRALVVGEQHLPEIALHDGGRVVAAREPRFLEIVPSGITREAAALTGPLLFSCARRLGPGSVLTAALVLEDPTRHALPGPGLLARAVDYTVEVAVEP